VALVAVVEESTISASVVEIMIPGRIAIVLVQIFLKHVVEGENCFPMEALFMDMVVEGKLNMMTETVVLVVAVAEAANLFRGK
jgi:hypothetical protein